jgi:hypothetical protein
MRNKPPMKEVEMDKIYFKVKGFVSRHKVGLAFGAGVGTMYLLNRTSIKEWNNFLAEKGLTDEFYKGE